MKFQEKIVDLIFEKGPEILFAVLIAIIGYFIIKLIIKLVSKACSKADVDVSLKGFFERVIKIFGWLIIIISVLGTLGISTTGLIAGLSAAAAAIALALKDSLSNIAGGIIILFTKPFKTGDFIETANHSGFVQRVDIAHTMLLTLDNRRVVIPNSLLSGGTTVNCSAEDIRRVDLTFSISYEADAKAAEKIAVNAMKAHKNVLSSPDLPFARVLKYSESSVDISTRAWCKTEDYWTVYFDLIEQIKKAFDENKIKIPFNQLDVRIVK